MCSSACSIQQWKPDCSSFSTQTAELSIVEYDIFKFIHTPPSLEPEMEMKMVELFYPVWCAWLLGRWSILCVKPEYPQLKLDVIHKRHIHTEMTVAIQRFSHEWICVKTREAHRALYMHGFNNGLCSCNSPNLPAPNFAVQSSPWAGESGKARLGWVAYRSSRFAPWILLLHKSLSLASSGDSVFFHIVFQR
jgi:hypothetical protein